ncbi:hypothetical protein TVAG_344250 [Trichomonas vaginalis G3]|uniref:Uncharacterized protein n=1 Tax=Trichomonas vaginalis (strain ATCC PRA-98 / G3) TaxID=412133 RepID=A2E7P6_TRIV3|nr:guanylate cyclase protein [Trichomonas vaginalis G3]EAY11331.1 hypothetical protein TVAG_344250 [Trichomonas vaginalis G3]KAI5523774.1 guanylate cyclase protein [Trichomonas vaginalis G3]|eukprot:XP_001323554.1 hypothetical protein [Trichomonas vaginalis G3]
MAANQQNPTVSASISTESTNQALDISKGTKFIDETFPLFSTMFQQVKIPIPVVYPFLTIFFVQVLFVSVWPFCRYWDQYESLPLLK